MAAHTVDPMTERMNGLRDIQTQILDAIAPANWRELRITSATLQIKVRKIPTLTLECDVIDPPRAQITRTFELRPIPQPAPVEPAFDLDAAMQSAHQRVAASIEASAEWHGHAIRAKGRQIAVRGAIREMVAILASGMSKGGVIGDSTSNFAMGGRIGAGWYTVGEKAGAP